MGGLSLRRQVDLGVSDGHSKQRTNELEVVVSGGSMGGLFTGIALGRAGHDVTVYEQSTGALRSRGAGIVAQQNIRRFLDQHGIVAPEEITTGSSERRFLTSDGDVRRSRAESMVFTSWDAVYRQLRDAFPDQDYHMGEEVVEVAPETATVTLADGTERSGDLMVAAEGGQSSTRRQLFPDVSPEFADYVAWRGVVPESSLSGDVVDAFDDRFTFYQGSDHLMLAYFIPGEEGGTARGERRLNWVWYDTLADRDRATMFTDANGSERTFSVPPGELRDPVLDRQLGRAAAELPSVFTTIVRETEAPFVQAIYDLRVPEMVVDRVCLLGDAAFVARPHTAAGTSKAAGDAIRLADALDRHDSLADALSAWDDARTSYGSRLVTRGQQLGDERLGLA